MEWLKVFKFFANASEFDRFASDGFHAQGSAAARITVEFGQDGAGDVESLIKMRRNIDRFLAGGGVEDEQRFLRFDEIAKADQFLDEWFVDLETASGVKDEGVAIVGFGEIERATGNFQDVGFTFAGEDWELKLLTKFFELVHGRRAIDVGGNEQGRSALLKEETAQFATGSCFAGAVQAHHQDATGIAAELYAGIGRAEEFDEFVVNDFDDLLARLDAEKNFLADGFVFDALDKVASDFEINVGFKEGETDFAEGIADVFLGDLAETAQVFERFLKLGA
jgi:hypothetical protein